MLFSLLGLLFLLPVQAGGQFQDVAERVRILRPVDFRAPDLVVHALDASDQELPEIADDGGLAPADASPTGWLRQPLLCAGRIALLKRLGIPRQQRRQGS